MSFGILQRYVMGEVLRAFALAALTMTIVFVLFMVMAEAAKLGLSPRDTLTLVFYVIPGTLPYIVPVSMLFSVTIVFGRLASDNEIIAVKTAGLSAMAILWPVIILGGAFSGFLFYLSHGPIPLSNQMAKLTIFKSFEDAFFTVLKVERSINNGLPYAIFVHDVDVESRTLFDAIIKHRADKGPGGDTFDMVIQAKKARIRFDLQKGEAHIILDDAEISNGGRSDDVAIVDGGEEIVMPIPDKTNTGYETRNQERTSKDLTEEQKDFRRKIARERKRQAIAAALWIGSGRLQRVRWQDVQASFVDYGYWMRRVCEYETEKQLRSAQAFGTLFFVLLGAPVGILFAKRDFLSAFISCFVPIIILYYPLMLLGQNLGKEDVLNPMIALWSGNVLLAILAGFTLPPVIRH